MKNKNRRMTTHRSLPIIVLLMLPLCKATAQDDADFRMEIGAGVGTSYYLGDLNTGFYKEMGFAGRAVWRYLFDYRQALKVSLSYGAIKGEASVVNDYYPTDPESGTASSERLYYDFSSGVVDLSCLYEINFWPYGYYRDFTGRKRLTPYLQLGIGFTYGPEGEAFTVNFPIGVGVKYRLSKRLNLSLDWTIHFSLSDELDGLKDPQGIKGEGLKNKDSYQLTMLTLTYSFAPICPNCNKE